MTLDHDQWEAFRCIYRTNPAARTTRVIMHGQTRGLQWDHTSDEPVAPAERQALRHGVGGAGRRGPPDLRAAHLSDGELI